MTRQIMLARKPRNVPVITYDWDTRTLAAPWEQRDGGMLVHHNSKWWLVGGWNPYSLTWPGGAHPTTNEVWSSDDLITWTQELTHDDSPPTSGGGARFKRRHWPGLIKHTHSGTDYVYVLGGDHLSSTDGDFSGSPSNGYQCDVWRSTNMLIWERVCASDDTSWSGRMLAVFGSSPGKLWCFGGQNGLLGESSGSCVVHNDLHVSTDGGATWSVALADASPSSTRPSGRGILNRLAYWDGRLWLVGGGTYSTAADADRHYPREVWSIDPENTAAGWLRHANPPWLGNEYANVEVFNDELWFMAGFTGDGYAGGDLGTNTRFVWSTADGEYWRRHDSPPWIYTHAAGSAVSTDGTELGFVAGNGSLTNDPPYSEAHALVFSNDTTVVPRPLASWDVAQAVVSGGNIVSIPDSTGNGHTLVVETAGDATYNASDSDFDGKPSAETDGGAFLKTTNAIPLRSFTLFIVGKFEQSATGWYTFYALAGSDYAYGFHAIDGSITDRVSMELAVHRGGVTTGGSGSQLFDNAELQHVYAYHYDGTAAGSQIRIDGAAIVPKDSPFTGDAGTAVFNAVLHILSDNTGAGSKPGKIAAARLYPALTVKQRQAVENELIALYPYTAPP